jgi:hypothetical protein
MRIAPIAAAVLVALALAACSSTGGGNPTTAPSSSGSPTIGGLTQTQAQSALLTAAEVGHGFAQAPTDSSGTNLPCTPNAPTLSAQFPPDVKVQADFGGAAGKALFSEEIETFADADTVAQVVAAGEQGLACTTATVGGAKVTILGPTDLTSGIPVPVDKGETWLLTTKDVHLLVVIVEIDNQLVVFSVTGARSIDRFGGIDPSELIIAGLRKVRTALQ